MVASAALDTQHPLATLRLLDPQGRAVRLSDLWRDRPAVFVFVRHFGCLFCKQQVAEVRARLADFEKRGARVVVVGNGSVEDCRAFVDEHAPDVTVLTDPTREAYCAMGMKQGALTSLSPKVFTQAWKATRQGFTQTRTQGAAFQQGGVVVVAPGGRELYRYISQEAGDHPALDDVIARL